MGDFFAIGIVRGKNKHNVGTLYRSARLMGASFIFTVGKRYPLQSSDTTKSHRHIPHFEFESMQDLVAHLPYGCRLVGIELDERSKPLHEYRHPRNCCYLLGAEDHGLTKEQRLMCHELVEIHGPANCLNVAVAGSILMYDRLRQFNRQIASLTHKEVA